MSVTESFFLVLKGLCFFFPLPSKLTFCMNRVGKMAVYQAVLSQADGAGATQEGLCIPGVITVRAFCKNVGTK